MPSYITKTNLSLGPQFGSQMTQYAGLYAVAKKLNMEIVFTEQQMPLFRGVKLFDAFNLPNKIINGSSIALSPFTLKDTVLDDRVFQLDSTVNWDIDGWFHTYHYFHEYENEIRQVFSFNPNIQQTAEQQVNAIRANEPYPLVALHVRRGDYLAVSSLNLPTEYYEQAIQVFLKQFQNTYFKLLVFSDDVPWCKENIVGENVFYSEHNSNYVDMCMMSLCDHNIIANSSFSWWGAYLNPSSTKTVVCPREYVGPSDQAHQFINGNYYPSTWVPISVTS